MNSVREFEGGFMVDNVVILAGGAGKRLWPASMGSRPKQFMEVGPDGTLYYQTLKRAFGLGIAGKVYVVTHEDHVEAARTGGEGLAREEMERLVILAEPFSRNTAPALALAAAFIRCQGGVDEISLILSADHLISPLGSFGRSVGLASAAAAEGFIVTFGIRPSEPNTGYGYVEVIGGEGADAEVYDVRSFREKPDEASAREYVESGNYFWNAGMFAYRNDCFCSEMALCEPELSRIFSGLKAGDFVKTVSEVPECYQLSEVLGEMYRGCPSISIDYAMMERARRVRMVRADFEWNDVGSWDAMADLGYGTESPVYSYLSGNNFVYSDCPVALCGVDDLIVVVRNNRVLVCRRGDSQLVRNVARDDEA